MYDLSPSSLTPPSPETVQLEDFLHFLKQSHQVDLTGYKRSILLRRTRARMQQTRINHYQDYLDYLQQQPDEVTHLLNTVFINYTSFFRDRPIWDRLANKVIPKIIESKAPDEPIRVWSAGCASGEETYSLAILFAEALGIEQFQQRVRIYGTDVDEDAVLQAQKGCYSRRAAAAVPSDFLERYFEPDADSYRWRRELCRITFHRHDLIQASPLPRTDLLVCRNMLIYLMPEAQIQALLRFHFSLQQQGFLLLGRAESLVNPFYRELFTPMDFKARLFTKGSNRDHRRQWLPVRSSLPLGLIASRQMPDPMPNQIPNKRLNDRTDAKYPLSSSSLLQKADEQQSFQSEIMQHEIEWLQEQVRSLQDELHCRIQQQHEIEQELKATRQELELMNQEIQQRMRMDPV